MSRVLSFPALLVGAGLGVCAPALTAAQQQATTITGRVTGEGGQPLPAVSVFIPSLSVGTTTRADGAYTFAVPAGRGAGQTVTLTARIVGYRAQSVQITLAGRPVTQNFTLVAAPTTLSAVVVTGAGTTSTRERLGNVVNSVDSTALQRAAEPQNVVSALAGKAPNVEIRTQAGDPGASASVRIRGATSIQGSQEPLFVVDNQPIDNSTISTNGGNQSTVTPNRAADINPNDIESIEILKGAAAAAIYGARAANGVVLITTKRGRAGQTRYTLQSRTGFDQVFKRDVLQQRFGLGSAGETPTCFGPTAPVNCAVGIGAAGAWGPSITGPSFDTFDQVFGTGNTFDNNLTITGGAERTTYFLSAGLTDQRGVIEGPNNFADRASLRLKANQQVSRTLNVGGNITYVNSNYGFVQKGSNTSGLLLGALRTPPNFDNREYLSRETGLHRSYRFPNPGSASQTISRRYDNPFFTLNNPGNRQELGRAIGQVNVDYQPVEWLRVQYTLGADNYADERRESLPLTASTRPDGLVTAFTITNLQIDHNLTARASHQFNPNVFGSLTLGQNLNARRVRQNFVQGATLIAPEPLNLQNTLSYVPNQFRSRARIAGHFVQGTLDLYEQLYLTGLVRNDGFSTFGSSNRFATYPAGTVAWVFTNALGNRDQRGRFSYGKLRLGYGESGKEPGLYSTVTALSTGQNAFGSGFGDILNAVQAGQGAVINGTQLGNADLRPERTRELEGGVDLGFLDQRVSLGITAYNKRSSDVLLNVPVSVAQTGRTTALRNAATVRNRGLEVELNANVLRAPQYTWDLRFQFGRNRNEVLNLSGAQFVPFNTEGFTGSIGSATVGFPIGVVRGNDFARCGRGLEIDGVGDIDALCGAGAPRDALFLGADGLPVFDPTDRVIANPQPDWTAGFGTTARLGRFTLSGFLDWRRGGQVWNGTRGILYYFGTHRDTEIRSQTGGYGRNWQTDVYPVVAGPGVGVTPFESADDWQSWLQSDGGGFGAVSAQFVENASFAKLREVTLGYETPARFARRIGLSSLAVSVSGRNLAMWTNYKGFDPEANLGGAEFTTQGLDYFNNPMSRSVVLTVTLNR